MSDFIIDESNQLINADTSSNSTESQAQALVSSQQEHETFLANPNIIYSKGNVLNALSHVAQQLASSNILPSSICGNPGSIYSILFQAYELNISPMMALNKFHVIDGRVTMPPEIMLSLIRSRVKGVKININKDHDKNCVTCTMSAPGDESPTVSKWTLERAEQMQLTNKKNWQRQPLTMLKWRAVAEAARERFGDVISGMYTPDEMITVVEDRRAESAEEKERRAIEAEANRLIREEKALELKEKKLAEMREKEEKEAAEQERIELAYRTEIDRINQGIERTSEIDKDLVATLKSKALKQLKEELSIACLGRDKDQKINYIIDVLGVSNFRIINETWSLEQLIRGIIKIQNKENTLVEQGELNVS